MFTSRAEFRILLRQDNADIRLTEKAFNIGLASKERLDKVNEKIAGTQEIIKFFKKESISQNDANPILEAKESALINQQVKINTLLSRPNVEIKDFKSIDFISSFLSKYDRETIEQAEILIKYEGYIEKEKEVADKHQRLENYVLKEDFDYSTIVSLSAEAKQKLNKIKPSTIGQASRISGINPADISVLIVHLGR
jgi:tRNA uridine 5-carboxymethylaminomethyl modification enzyme